MTLASAPDGRWVAVVTESGELGLLDLEAATPVLHRYSTWAQPTVGWSPDSTRLAFVEVYPNAPPEIWVVDRETGRAPRALLGGVDWKASPVWLDGQRLAYLSDRGADDINIWQLDARDGSTRLLFDRESDVSRLWSAPGGGLVFQSVESGSTELWWWPGGDAEPERLTRDESAAAVDEIAVAFGEGGRMAWLADRGGRQQLVLYDLTQRETRSRLELNRPAGDLALLGDGRAVVVQGREIWLWEPDPGWFEAEVREVQWSGLELGPVAALGQRGVLVVVGGNALLTAEDAGDLEDGRLTVRATEDTVRLAWLMVRAGETDQARAVLEDLAEDSRPGSRDHYLAAMAMARMWREDGSWRRADGWIARAVESAHPDSPEAQIARAERLAIACFNAGDIRLTRWLLDGGEDADPPTHPLANWLRRLVDVGREDALRAWSQAVGAMRRGAWQAAAGHIETITRDAALDPETSEAFELLASDQIDPIQIVRPGRHDMIDNLLDQAAFIDGVMRWLKRRPPGDPLAEEWRRLLLAEWVGRRNYAAARRLVAAHLEASPMAVLDYRDLLLEFLTPEETDSWVERGVTDVLLHEDVRTPLSARFEDPLDLAALELARVKHALILGAPKDAAPDLRAAREHLAAARAGEADEVDALRQAQLRYMLDLLSAKVAETEGDWPTARQAYLRAAAAIEGRPGNWTAAPFDLAVSLELIDEAGADKGGLDQYLTQLRGMGDPSYNPSSDPGTLTVGLSNLQTLRELTAGSWLTPYIVYSQGLGYAQLNRAHQALCFLERARQLGPPPALLRRILLEEAALRDLQGQHALAARLYARLSRFPMSRPARTYAVLARIQAEFAAGLIRSQEQRLAELIEGLDVEGAWREWLWLYVGAELDAS